MQFFAGQCTWPGCSHRLYDNTTTCAGDGSPRSNGLADHDLPREAPAVQYLMDKIVGSLRGAEDNNDDLASDLVLARCYRLVELIFGDDLASRELLLRVSAGGEGLLSHILDVLSTAEGSLTVHEGALRLLILWASNCSSVIQRVFTSPSHISAIMLHLSPPAEQNSGERKLLRGLAAMFLAVSISTMSQSCAAGGNDKDMKTLMRVLKSVGVKAYASACEMCEASVAVERDAKEKNPFALPDRTAERPVVVDPYLLSIVRPARECADKVIIEDMTSIPSGDASLGHGDSGSEGKEIERLRGIVAVQEAKLRKVTSQEEELRISKDVEIDSLKKQLEAAAAAAAAEDDDTIVHFDAQLESKYSAELSDLKTALDSSLQANETNKRCDDLCRERDDLLVLLANMEIENAALVEELHRIGGEEAIDAAKAAAEAALEAAIARSKAVIMKE